MLWKKSRAQTAFKEPGAYPVLAQGDELPKHDALISYLTRLKHASPVRIISAIAPNLSSIGAVIQIANTELLVINDVTSSIKRIEKMLALLDVPSETITTRVFPLRNLSVDKAQLLLNEYLQALSRATIGEAQQEKAQIIKDERQNALHLIGSEKTIQQIDEFLKLIDLDAPSAERTIKYYKLKNVLVKDIVDYVGQLLGVALTVATESRLSEMANQPSSATQGQPQLLLQGAPRMPTELQPVASAQPQSSTILRSATAQSKSDKKGALKLPADIIPVDGLNTLVVSGDARVHREVEAILKNLDKRKGQVLIEVAIVQVTGDDSLDLGFEGLSINNDHKGRQLDGGSGFGLGQQRDRSQNRGFPTETALPNFTGAAFRFAQDNKLQIVLTALATKGNVSIISQPLLLVNDNEAASFTTKVSEPTITTSQGTATTNTSFAGFADATTSLKITPHISPDGYLNLEINQTFEEFTGQATAAGIPPPKVSNNADTKVTVPDRQTIVIGGFTRDSAMDSRSGVPGLMKIPGLGKLFSRENKRKTASRLYLFVRPKILATTTFVDLEDESNLKKSDAKHLAKESRIKSKIDEGLNSNAEIVEPEKEKK